MNYLDTIITSGRPCYFISPHYDDAAFSAGALMNHLAQTNPVRVVNIFTAAGSRPYSLSAKAYLQQCGYTDAQQLYADRTAEDKAALRSITDQVQDLGFTEALWRRRPNRLAQLAGRLMPELGNIYPTYRFHAIRGKLARADQSTVETVSDQLRRIVPAGAAVFCPQAIGGHVDHLLVKIACERVFSDPIEWSDYPYNAGIQPTADTARQFSFTGDSQAKLQLMAGYATQYQTMFGTQAELRPESFIIR